ncbi:TonB-dependent receptor [bacterium]|nr:TonB-dependent receptor [bacterium]
MHNRHHIKWIIGLWLFLIHTVQGDHCHIEGKVFGIEYHHNQQDTIPLYGAELYWRNTSLGTTTDDQGYYHLSKPEAGKPHDLVVRYVAYENDTLFIPADQIETEIILTHIHKTENVTIETEAAHHLDHLDVAVNTRTLSSSGLRTLACCNLSESFENTAAVDVEYTDVVSGAKRIKMLGLAGYYTQILIEKNPLMSGLISPYALEYIPGSWLQSIDISKGTSSVTTGYESITGQINVEIKKPQNGKPFFINGYQNSMGRTEGSVIGSKKISDRLHTSLLFYGTQNRKQRDVNMDTFLDVPILFHLNIMNRWSYQTGHSHVQWGVNAIRDHRDGGQKQFDFKTHRLSSRFYGFHNRTDRIQLFLKAGFALDHEQTSSIGLTVSGFSHVQNAFWGLKEYEGKQRNIFSSLTYQKSFDHHTIRSGLSMLHDDKTEIYQQAEMVNNESAPGAFFEYSLIYDLHFTAMAGIRYDRHNIYGIHWTPRFHIKYHLSPMMILRASAGQGFRHSNVLADNFSILASSKEIVFLETLSAEQAWNYGLQYYYDFALFNSKPVSIILDYYHTDFQNQIIVDQEQEINKIYIYNLDGKSRSNSFQAEISAFILKGLDITAAWRWNDVKTTYHKQLRDLPLTNRYKGLLVFSYTLPDQKWQMDFTAQFNGKTRLPDNKIDTDEYQIGSYSPAYSLFFGQVTRKFGTWEFYAGIENILNYKQKNPIVAWQDPFGPYFDSSRIWGPTVGRRIYLGLRLN